MTDTSIIGGHPLPWITRGWIAAGGTHWIEDARGHKVAGDMTAEVAKQIVEAVNGLAALQKDNLSLRGADQVVYFHGTNPAKAAIIEREGFKEGTYFARHMEDAAVFGGPVVFSVNVHFDKPSLDGWQVICANALPATTIRAIHRVNLDSWTPISPDNLSKVGDQVLDSGTVCAAIVIPENLDTDWIGCGFDYRRPLNTPAKEPK